MPLSRGVGLMLLNGQRLESVGKKPGGFSTATFDDMHCV